MWRRVTVFILSLAIIGCAGEFGLAHLRQRRAEAERLAYDQKIDDCIIRTLRQGDPPKLDREDILDQVGHDFQVEQARRVCVSNEAYDRERKHDRELYEKAFPTPAKAP